MKNLITKAVSIFTGANVHATHTAIKGRKSSGKEDTGIFYSNWKGLTSGTN